YAQITVALAFIALSAAASLSYAPFYRLYTNELGGGRERAGSFFPHDEFYDGSMRDAATAVAQLARPNARVASETPRLLTHYAQIAGRDDLVSVSLSDRAALRAFNTGDLIVVARGRRYFSNDELVRALESVSQPVAQLLTGDVLATQLYVLDEASHRMIAAQVK
ncbi:MAG: hypothetical protein M3371_05420, partial [Acidobacteriota bacterium]|nr:hypothetical protein [Acidobacteriota bacterium]